MNYRIYKFFTDDNFSDELQYMRLNEVGAKPYSMKYFRICSINMPHQKKILIIYSPFMNKLYKTIMARSKLRNKFLKSNCLESKNNYKRQWNYCLPSKRNKKYFYENPNLRADNRKFWKQVEPFFSDKTPYTSNITHLEENEIVFDNMACAEIFNNFLSKPVGKLHVNKGAI